MPKKRLLSAVLAGLSVMTPASSEVVGVADRVFLVPDAPGAGTRFQMIVGAGCLDEPEGRCLGLAHYLEHLVMLGRNAGHGDAAVRLIGDGGANGWTLERATVYSHILPARPGGSAADLERLFGFYAGRLRDFAITPADAARERDVVVQEHDGRVQGNAFVALERTLARMLLPDRPNGQWVVGEREALRAMTVEAARAFHRDWYHRNNVWFLVSGAVAPTEVKALAEKALAGLSEPPLPERPLVAPPEFVTGRTDLRQTSTAIRRAGVIVKKLVNLPEPDLVEARAARRLFGDFLASRLPGSLIGQLGDRDGLIATRPTITLERLGAGSYILHVGVDVAAGVDPAEVREAIVDYLEGLETNPGLDDPTVARLQRRFVNTQSDIAQDSRREFGQLASWLASGGTPDMLARWTARVPLLPPAAVRAFAAAFAGEGRVVTGILEPPGEN